MLLQLAIPILLAAAGVDACRERETTKQPEIVTTEQAVILTSQLPEIVTESAGKCKMRVKNPLPGNSSLTIGVQAKIEYNATFLRMSCVLPDGYDNMLMTVKVKSRAENQTGNYNEITLECIEEQDEYGVTKDGVFDTIEIISCHAYNGDFTEAVLAEIEDLHDPEAKCPRTIQAPLPVNTTLTVGVQAKIDYYSKSSLLYCAIPDGYEHVVLILQTNMTYKNGSVKRSIKASVGELPIKLQCSEQNGLHQYGFVDATEETFSVFDRIWCHAYNGDFKPALKELDAIYTPTVSADILKLSAPMDVHNTKN